MTSSANGRGPSPSDERALAELLARAQELGIEPRRVITALAISPDVVRRVADRLRSRERVRTRD